MRSPVTLSSNYFRVSMLVAAALAAGCAGPSPMVRSGDQAAVDFTCRFANGDLAVSSSSTIGLGDGLKRSAVFFPRETSDPIVIEAGRPGPLPDNKVRPMEEEALQQLREAVIGLRAGERRSVELHSSIDRQGIVKYNKVFVQPKERRLKVEDFKARTGTLPKVGAQYEEVEGFPGSIVSVNDDEVVIRYPAQPDQVPHNFFGSGVVVDEGNQYRITFAADKGKLVRSGYLVGRVVDSNEATVSIDFGDPFAGETLWCDVEVKSLTPAATTSEDRPRSEDKAVKPLDTDRMTGLQEQP